jgi:hypothetical protein
MTRRNVKPRLAMRLDLMPIFLTLLTWDCIHYGHGVVFGCFMLRTSTNRLHWLE